MAFRPVSVTSTFHKRLAIAMGKQHTKQQKVRHTVTVVDPKKAKEEREKAEEERIRGRENLSRRQVYPVSCFEHAFKLQAGDGILHWSK